MESIGTSKDQHFGHTTGEGWYSIHIEGAGLPDTGVNFELAVTYLGAAR